MSPCKYKVYDNKPYVGKMRILYQSAPCPPLGALQQPFLDHLFFGRRLVAPRDNLPCTMAPTMTLGDTTNNFLLY